MGPLLLSRVAHMNDAEGTPASDPDETAAFETTMRQHRRLMEQMADREHWEVDPLWLKVGRAIAFVAISFVAVAGIAFAVFVLATN